MYFDTNYLMIFYSHPIGANAFPGTETRLESNTNAPDVKAPANNLPHELVPFTIVISLYASMFPFQVVFV